MNVVPIGQVQQLEADLGHDERYDHPLQAQVVPVGRPRRQQLQQLHAVREPLR